MAPQLEVRAGVLPQWPGPETPLLKSSSICVFELVADGCRWPAPTGGITSAPICRSAAAIVPAMVVGFAPLARFSLAAMSWCASEIRPLPATGLFRIESSWAAD